MLLLFFSHFAIIGPKTVLYKSAYKCILSSNYANNDEARVEIMLAGISSKTEIDSYMYSLKQDAKPITVKFDVSIIVRLCIDFGRK